MTRSIHPLRPGRKARIAGIVAAALVISWGGPAAGAYWQTLGSGRGAAKADSILTMPAPEASVTGGAATVTWAPGTTAVGRPVSGYTVARYSSPTGPKVAAGGGCSGEVKTAGCTESNLPAGTWQYTITPVLGSWAGAESAPSAEVTGDSTPPPIPTFDAPQSLTVNIANAASATVKGTAEAGSSVTVTVTDSPVDGSAQRSVSTTVSADTNGQWTITNFDLRELDDGTISYVAVATDAAGNASGPRTAPLAMKDTVAPTASIRLQTGPAGQKNVAGRADQDDQIVISFSEPMNPASICSAWTSTPPAVLKNAGIQVRIEPTKNLKFVVPASTCPTFTLGNAVLGGAFSSGSADLVFAGGGNNATAMAWSTTATSSTLTITLGSHDGTKAVVGGTVQSTFTAVDGPRDANGNPISLLTTLGDASNF